MTSQASPRRCAGTTKIILPSAPIAARARNSIAALTLRWRFLTSLSALFFLFALAVLKHIRPLEHVAFKILGLDIYDMYHMLVSAGIAGLCFSLIAMALVLMATPAPSYLGGIAAERARLIESASRPSARCVPANANLPLPKQGLPQGRPFCFRPRNERKTIANEDGWRMSGFEPKGNTEIPYNWNKSATKKEIPA